VNNPGHKNVASSVAIKNEIRTKTTHRQGTQSGQCPTAPGENPAELGMFSEKVKGSLDGINEPDAETGL
jgi:hypothetical protein